MGINDLAIDPVTLRLGSFAPLPSAAAFTVRSGATYQSLLEDIRAWLRDDLIPFLNENTGQQQWDALADILAARIQAALNQQQSNVNTQLADALAKVIAAHIVVSDPIVDTIVGQTPKSETRKLLDYIYGLTDDKLLYFLNVDNNGNSATQFKARIDELYKITSDKIRNATDTSNSVFRDWLDGRYVNGASFGCAPGWGGDSGARLGDNGGTNGNGVVLDDMRIANMRLAFGSTAIWGGSVLTGLSALGNLDLSTVVADGVYEPSSGGPARNVTFLPLNSNDMRCYIDRGNGLEVINVLPNPPQSSTMRISIRGRVIPSS